MDTPVSGAPRTLLRVEGLAVLIASVLGYRALGASWLQFALLLLVPDIALVGYAGGPRMGAILYNGLHTYAGPALLAGLAFVASAPVVWPSCLIWVANIGMDRGPGLGLKYPSAFQATHLGHVGRIAPTA